MISLGDTMVNKKLSLREVEYQIGRLARTGDFSDSFLASAEAK